VATEMALTKLVFEAVGYERILLILLFRPRGMGDR
jgi:hypothetical protein